jgi:hypothetical protein
MKNKLNIYFMKNIQSFKKFNEAIFTSLYDKQLKEIFNRIKLSFDINSLKEKGYDGYEGYEYTHIDSDYTKDLVLRIKKNHADFTLVSTFNLYIDNEEINCSHILARIIYTFFNSKWLVVKKEEEKNRKLDILNKKSFN